MKLLLLGRSGGGTGFRAFRTILGAGLTALIDSEGIERTTNDVVTDTWKVFYPATANENDRVFLEVVTFTTDVSDDFKAIGETHFGDFTERGVRLLWRPGHDLEANAAALRAVDESGRFRLLDWNVASFANELINGRHDFLRVSGFVLKRVVGTNRHEDGVFITRNRFFPELHPIISLYCG